MNPFGDGCERVFQLAFLNSFYETGVSQPVDRASKNNSNPLDDAILKHDQSKIEGFRKIDEMPFDFERRRVSVVIEERDQKRTLISKGAPESVFSVCSTYEIDGRILPFDKDARNKSEMDFQDFSRKGLRVLAVACCTVEAQDSYAKTGLSRINESPRFYWSGRLDSN